MESKTLSSLIKFSPAVLLTSMCLSFVVMGGLQIFFYADVFRTKMDSGFVYAIAVAIALILQGSRFAFGLAAVNESYRGKYLSMGFGLLFSLGLTVLETYEVAEIATQWQLGNYAQSVTIILFAVLWVGFALELRLILNLAGKGENEIIPENTILNDTSGEDEKLRNMLHPGADKTGVWSSLTNYYLENKLGNETVVEFYARMNGKQIPTNSGNV